jgi:integrase
LVRRGEVLGLRWDDIDTGAELIRVRQQLLRVQGQLIVGPVKTRARNRDLPLLGLAKAALDARRQAQDTDRANLGRCWADTGLVFTTKTGRPVEPRNLVRSFTRICQNHGIRRIRSTASGTPSRPCQNC